MKRIVLAATVALAMTACAGTNFKWDSARQIKAGMTEQEVTSLMGQPYLVKSEAGRLIWVWSHANGFSGATKSLSVVFVDGKVIEPPPISDSFN